MGDLLTVIAAVAALLAVWYARATVLIARDARKDAATAHAEQMARQAEQLRASTKAHEQEMLSRTRQVDRDLWVQRLTRLGRLQDLLGETADIGRAEIKVPPARIQGQPGTWTRVTGALLRVEAELSILEMLDCELPSSIRETATDCRRVGVQPGEVVSRTMGALQVVLHAAENNPAFKPPGEPSAGA